MDKRCYLWIFKNLSKYSFTADAISIKESIARLLLTEDTIDAPEIIQKMENYYEQLVSNFYNNIIGYRNGLADKMITAAELDCYFILTADGMIPIGYYRETRPVEAAMLMQKYIQNCENDVPKEKNKMISDWQSELDLISSNYQEKKDKKHSGLPKCIASLSFCVVGIILSVISFFMSGGFTVLSGTIGNQVVNSVRSIMPCLARASATNIKAFAWCMLIFAIILLVTSVLLVWELKLAKDKKTTDDLLNHSHTTVAKIETGIQHDIKNSMEEIRSAARQGREFSAEQNQNSRLPPVWQVAGIPSAWVTFSPLWLQTSR